jgi:hypothetical protein
VNVKYKTKNNITDDNPVFLAIINHTKTKTSSRRNLRLTETRVCMTFKSGSFDCPLKKRAMLMNIIAIKTDDAIATSRVLNPALKRLLIRNAAEISRPPRSMRRIEYFKSGFKRRFIL